MNDPRQAMTVGDFTALVARLFGTHPEQVSGWALVIHDQAHGLGYMTSRESDGRPASLELAVALFGQVMAELTITLATAPPPGHDGMTEEVNRD